MDIEAERPMAFHSDLKEELVVRHFVGFEKLGECFEYVVTLYSKNANLDLSSILGKHATVEVRKDMPSPRFFDGIVTEFSHLGGEETYCLYRVVLRPWLWLLSKSRGCEIFQNLSVVDIARDMFGKGTGDKESTKKRMARSAFALFEDRRLKIKPPKREYVVQYRESDLDFVNRLFEQNGIYYYFTHEQGKHTLVLADSVLCHEPAKGYEEIKLNKLENLDKPEVGRIVEWTTTKQMATGVVKLRDYDFKKSRATLAVDKSKPKKDDLSKSEIFDFPGGYEETGPGGRLAQTKLEEQQASRQIVRAQTDCRGIYSGCTFISSGHLRKKENTEYLLVSIRYEFDAGSYQSGGAITRRIMHHVTALPSEIQYRPPRRTAIPFIPGPQSARVVGPKGSEVWTDEFARVKIQFPWDHDGKYDDKSSCFVRVCHGWAGTNWGAFFLPRVGQEVLVDFVDGDIDRPVVIGRLYNNVNEIPYKPQKRPGHAGIKTQTLSGGPDQYNELRFDDTKDEEEIHVRAQRDLTTKVLHDKTTTVDNDHKHTVTKNMAVTVEDGEYTTVVQKKKMDISVPLAEFHVSSLKNAQEADLNITLQVLKNTITIDLTSITLSVPGSTIRLGPEGITINGIMVNIGGAM